MQAHSRKPPPKYCARIVPYKFCTFSAHFLMPPRIFRTNFRGPLRTTSRQYLQGAIIYAPPPPPFLAKRHFPGEGGGGVYFEAPRGRNCIRPPPPFYTPPTPRRVFSGVGGWGCVNFGPVISFQNLQNHLDFRTFPQKSFETCPDHGRSRQMKLVKVGGPDFRRCSELCVLLMFAEPKK